MSRGPAKSLSIGARFTPDEVQAIDQVRGDRSRSAWVRWVTVQRLLADAMPDDNA